MLADVAATCQLSCLIETLVPFGSSGSGAGLLRLKPSQLHFNQLPVSFFVLAGLFRAPPALEYEDKRKEHGDASEAHPEPVLPFGGRLVGLRLQGHELGTNLLQVGQLRLDAVDDRQVRAFSMAR